MAYINYDEHEHLNDCPYNESYSCEFMKCSNCHVFDTWANDLKVETVLEYKTKNDARAMSKRLDAVGIEHDYLDDCSIIILGAEENEE